MAHIKTRTVRGERKYDVCWRAHGKSRSKTFTRKVDAQRYEVEIERKTALGQLWEADPVTLQQARDDWRSRWMLGKAASTVARVDQAWPHVAPIGHVPLCELQPNTLRDTYTKAARVAPRQAQLAAQTVKQVLRDAQTGGQRFTPELLAIKAASYESRDPVFLTAAEVDVLASWCSQPRLIVFLAFSGLRIGEAVALRDTEVDRDSRSILVVRSASRGVEGKTKNRKHRRVQLCDRAWQALLEQLAARKPTEKGIVFTTPTGLLWDTGAFRRQAFAPAVKRAALELPASRRDEFSRVTVHDLRHSYASLMLRAGVDVRAVADQMGHSDGGALLLRRYAHLFPGSTARAAELMDAMLAGDREAVQAHG